MQKLLIALLLVFLAGCTTVSVSNYIPSKNPYARRVYSDFEKVSQSVRTVLSQERLAVLQEVDPAVYERDERYDNPGTKNLLIITDLKQYSRVLYSQYVHLNVYIRSLSDATEVEIRFGKVNSMLFSKFKGNRNDRYAQQLLDRIEALSTQ